MDNERWDVISGFGRERYSQTWSHDLCEERVIKRS